MTTAASPIWTTFTEGGAAWNAAVMSLEHYSARHSYEWGSLQDRPEAPVARYVVRGETGAVTAAVQLSVRRKFGGVRYFVSEGGIAGDLTAAISLKDRLLTDFPASRWYLRLFLATERKPIRVAELLGAGFAPALCRLHTGVSMTYELKEPGGLATSGSRDWRENLKKGKKRITDVAMWESPTAREVIELFRRFEQTKELYELYTEEQIVTLIDRMGPLLKIARAKNADGQVVSMRAACVLGKSGLDLFAATSSEGRSLSASYTTTNTLFDHLLASGVVHYDLGGIDPVGGPGVYHFKRGMGAEHYEYCGEWDQASSGAVRFMANAVMWCKIQRAMRKKH